MRWVRLARAQVIRYPALAVGAGLLIISTLLSAAAGRMAYQAERDLDREVEDRTREGCEASNEGRALTREVAVDVGVESAEAVIEVAAAGDDPPDEATIDRYREAVQRRMEAIAAQLVDRDCGAELSDGP